MQKQNKTTDLGVLLPVLPRCFQITTLERTQWLKREAGRKEAAQYGQPPGARLVSNHARPAKKNGDTIRLRVGDNETLA